MNDIVLNGVSISELKRMKVLIHEDAAKFIAAGIRDAGTLMECIINADAEQPFEELEAAAAQAADILHNVNTVSDVSGVTFQLPCYGNYGDRPFTARLEEADSLENVILYTGDGPLQRLYEVVENIEDRQVYL